MTRLRWVPALLVLVGLLSACGGGNEGSATTGSGPVKIAASTSVFADLVRQVGGERLTVTTLIPPGADAHTFQPAPRDVKRLGEMRAVFLNGRGLEASLEGVIANNAARDARVVQLSDGLTAIDFEATAVGGGDAGGEGHEEGGNPHFWLDVANARHYVGRIRDTLVAVDAEGQATYQANAARYLAELDGLDQEIRAAIQRIPEPQRKLVTFHDAFPYYAKAYGLEVAGYVVRAPGRDPSAQEIKDLSATLRREQVKTVFKEPQFNAKLLDQAAKDAGVRVDVLYTDALTRDITTYVQMMRRNTENIVKGLS